MLEGIVEYFQDEEILKADGFDDAVIGIDTGTMRLIYSVTRCVEILIVGGMDMNDAIEYFDFGVKFGLLFQKIDDYLDCFKKDEIGKNGFDDVNNINNFIKIAEGFGVPGKKITNPADVPAAVAEMLAHTGPYLLHCMVEKEENVFPMVPSGKGVSEIILEAPNK